MCLRVLSEQNPVLAGVFGEQSRSVFAKMLQIREQEAKTDKKVRVLSLDKEDVSFGFRYPES